MREFGRRRPISRVWLGIRPLNRFTLLTNVDTGNAVGMIILVLHVPTFDHDIQNRIA